MAGPLKPYGQRPFDPSLGDETNNWIDWATSALNQLIGQNKVPPAKGFPSLSVPVVDPTSSQITSAGARPYSITSVIGFTTSTTGGGVATITMFWDGTNGSDVFKVARDDGTQYGPNPAGSPLAVTALAASTAYFFYPYFDENMQKIVFVSVPGISVGTPPIAFLAANFAAKAQQILRSHIPIAPDIGTTGITTPAAGNSSSGSGGSGGGGGGGGGGHFR